MMLHNPYLETSFIKGETHVIQVWCEMFDIEPTVKLPELSINNRAQNFYGNQFKTPKPILLIQTNGGGKDQPDKYFWTRDLPLAN